MPDQDDFEPGGRSWKSSRDMYAAGADAVDIAFSVELALSRMIRECGGSAILRPVVEALQELARTRSEHPLWHELAGERHMAQFESTLQRLESLARDNRIDTVLLRTARSIAVRTDGRVDADSFAARVLLDVARHCCLDEARAVSVGTRFTSDVKGRRQAHDFQKQVFTHLDEGVDFLGKKWVRDPTGRKVRRRPRPRPTNLYDERLA
jgi:hypothetical protein